MEKYKEFNAETSGGTSEIGFKGCRFSKREIALCVVVLIFLLVIIILAALLASAKKSDDCGIPDLCNTPACLKTASHVIELVNRTTAQPCDDFYTFACGNFPKIHPLEPDETEVDVMDILREKNLERLRRIVESISSTEDPTHYEAKVKSFYASCMDHFQRTGLGGTPFLQQVVGPSGGWWVLVGEDQWPPAGYSFQTQLEKAHVDFWTDVFFSFYVGIDWLDWNQATIEIFLGGLGLSYGAYESKKTVDYYQQYIKKMGALLIADANLTISPDERDQRLDTFVNDVLFVEKELAMLIQNAKWEENPHALDRRPTLAQLNQNSSGEVDWVHLFQYMFNEQGSKTLVTADTHVVVYEQDYVNKFTAWLHNLDASNKTRVLNSYMIWQLAERYARFLSWDYMHLYNDFLMTTQGMEEMSPNWLICLRNLDSSMMDAMGALFVKRHFSDQNRQTADKMARNIRDALVENLSSKMHWMSEATRKDAKEKLTKSLIKLGYPEYMNNENSINTRYQTLTISSTDYFGNILSIMSLFRQEWILYFTHPGDRSLWYYGAYIAVVEYYSPWHELIIPAGTLQFPIFDHSSPSYFNYGGLGAIVGRELTHAIDETGNQFLLNGSHYGEWWSANTTKRYKEVRQCMIDAYKNYTMGPFSDLDPNLDNKKVFQVPEQYSPRALSESSGVKLAYRAYQKWVSEKGTEKRLPGGTTLNNDQLFFVSYAQSRCVNRHPTEEGYRVWLDGQVSERIKVNGALAQVQEFQAAFQCPDDSNMVAKTRCTLY